MMRMKLNGTHRVVSLAALVLWLACACAAAAAQTQGNAQAAQSRPAINYDVQLYLLVASNQATPHSEVPQAAEAMLKQLKTVLPFNDYHLALTFLNRVQEGGNLEYSALGGTPLAGAQNSPGSPTFVQFSLGAIKTATNAAGQPVVQVSSFRFGLKVPIQTATVSGGENNKAGYPVIQYQDTGIVTQLSVREDMPTVVGTLSSNKPDEAFVLLMTIRRATGG
jgi:hypothetical protein